MLTQGFINKQREEGPGAKAGVLTPAPQEQKREAHLPGQALCTSPDSPRALWPFVTTDELHWMTKEYAKILLCGENLSFECLPEKRLLQKKNVNISFF